MPRTKSVEEKRVPFSARLTPGAKNRLDALAMVTKETAYALVEKAFWVYWKNLDESVRSKAERIAATLEEPPATPIAQPRRK
jgi:predicted transcriptional regulator